MLVNEATNKIPSSEIVSSFDAIDALSEDYMFFNKNRANHLKEVSQKIDEGVCNTFNKAFGLVVFYVCDHIEHFIKKYSSLWYYFLACKFHV